MGRLEGKVAIITGSGRGLGKDMALRFAQEGADIVVNDILAKEMEATVQEVGKLGRKAIAVLADVSKKEDVTRLVDTAIATFSKVDILVNNAGAAHNFPLFDTTEEKWDQVIDVDLKGTFLCIQLLAPHMIKRKYGKIINIASGAGLGSGLDVAYAAAKAGVVQMTKSCARELGPHGINVNSIAPGAIMTDQSYKRTPEQVKQWVALRTKSTALGRVGTLADVSNLALFLASEESSFITGQTIPLNGGRYDRM